MMNPIVRCSSGRQLFCELLKKKEQVLRQTVRFFGDNATEFINRAVYTEDLPTRSLGGLEKYYYYWTNIWDDAFGCFTSFTSKYPINIAQLASAVSATVHKHPVLRLSFKKTDETVELVTRKENTANIEIVGREDFQLIFQSFSLEKKMWRLVLLNPDSVETTNLSFIFAVHHSLCDFTYNRAIIRDMLNSLTILQQGGCIEFEDNVALSEPIENLIQNTNSTGTETNINFPTTDWKEKRKITATDVCKRHFGEKYPENCRENTSKIIRWRIDKNLSQDFQSSISKCQGSMNSALLAVFLSSIIELVENSINQTEVVELPFSVMVNLRRYIGNDHVYKGNASIDTIGFITLDSVLKSKNDFWSLALEISKKMREIVTSGEPLRCLYEDVPEMDFQAILDSNLMEAIALTHTGHVDDFLGSEGHFNLVDYKINMRTSSDLGPIFNVETHFLQEELCVSLGYNCAFIPDTAAQNMAKIVNSVIKRIV